jgi:hypothetical protein
MKKLILAAVMCSAASVQAADFALIDLKAPVTSVGSFIDSQNGNSAAGGLVAIVTHKQHGMGVIDALISGWTPVTLGGTLGAGLGGPSVAMGTGVNLFPAAQATLFELVKAVSKDGQLNGLKVALAPSAPSATIFFGPQESLIFKNLNHYGTRLTWFIGASIAWN